jgi:hypothetical protein
MYIEKYDIGVDPLSTDPGGTPGPQSMTDLMAKAILLSRLLIKRDCLLEIELVCPCNGVSYLSSIFRVSSGVPR